MSNILDALIIILVAGAAFIAGASWQKSVHKNHIEYLVGKADAYKAEARRVQMRCDARCGDQYARNEIKTGIQ